MPKPENMTQAQLANLEKGRSSPDNAATRLAGRKTG